MLARFGAVGAVCSVVLLVGCGGAPVAGDAAVDVAPGPIDAAGLVPEACGDGVWRPTVLALDPATTCPSAIAVNHPFSSPNTCDIVRACCAFAPSCEFSTRLTLYLRGPCDGQEHLFPHTETIRGCRCVDGAVVCPNSAGVSSPCLDCDLGSQDGGL